VHKPAPRTRHETEVSTPKSGPLEPDNDVSMNDQPLGSSSSTLVQDYPVGEEALLKRLLRPPPIPGVENWGIPEAPSEPCDRALESKIRHFQSLKLQGRHFNDSLMSNKAFRNPHIYAKLVEFVEVDEMGTRFPKHLWDPFDLEPEWYADKIAAFQKQRSEQAATSQAAGKRSHIDFTSSSSRHASDKDTYGRDRDSRYQPYPNTSTAMDDRNRRHGGADQLRDQLRGDERDRRKEWGRSQRTGGGRDWRR